MARQNQSQLADGVPLWGLAEGLDKSAILTRIGELGLAEAWNVVIVDGVIKPRPGANAARYVVPQTASGIGAMFYNIRDRATQADTPIYMLWTPPGVGSGQNLTCYIYNGATWDFLAGFATGDSDFDTPPQATQFKDVTIVLPGNGPPKMWVPTSADFVDLNSTQANDALKSPIDCRFIASSGSRVFQANGIGFGTTERISHRVWWSDSGRQNVWGNGTGNPDRGSASYEDLGQDSYEITGMVMHSGMQLLVFKAWGIWAAEWRGEGVWYTFLSGTSRIGTIANRTIVQWRDQLLFLGTDYNVYMIGINRQITPVGNKMQRYISSIINRTYANRSCAAINPIENLYHLFIPISDEVFPRHVLTLNMETGAWTEGRLHEDCQVTSAYSYFPGYRSDPGIFLTQNRTQAELREYNYSYFEGGIGDDDGDFSAHISSKAYDFAEYFQGASETGEIHKIALQGIQGIASPRVRTETNLLRLTAEDFIEMAPQDMGAADPNHYSSDRTQANRLGQWGVKWAEGETNPLLLAGVMVWGKDRSAER